MSRTVEGRSRERGQSTVEFALVVPLLLVIVLGGAQVGLVVLAELRTAHAAREVGRALSVDPTVDADGLLERVMPGNPRPRVDVQYSDIPGTEFVLVEVIVTQRVPSVLGGAVPAVEARTEVAVVVEQGP